MHARAPKHHAYTNARALKPYIYKTGRLVERKVRAMETGRQKRRRNTGQLDRKQTHLVPSSGEFLS